MVHCGKWDWRIVWFVQQVCWVPEGICATVSLARSVYAKFREVVSPDLLIKTSLACRSIVFEELLKLFFLLGRIFCQVVLLGGGGGGGGGRGGE